MDQELYTAYAPANDMTFIMVDTFDEDGAPMATECIGWYFGEPNEEATNAFAGQLKAEYK